MLDWIQIFLTIKDKYKLFFFAKDNNNVKLVVWITEFLFEYFSLSCFFSSFLVLCFIEGDILLYTLVRCLSQNLCRYLDWIVVSHRVIGRCIKLWMARIYMKYKQHHVLFVRSESDLQDNIPWKPSILFYIVFFLNSNVRKENRMWIKKYMSTFLFCDIVFETERTSLPYDKWKRLLC